MNKINILGVNITKESKEAILNKIHSFLISKNFHYIVTPNPEIILKTLKDEELFYILNKADISLADGVGLKLSAFFLGKKLKRFTGSDLTNHLLAYAQKRQYKIAILNWRGGFSKKSDIEKSLKYKYPNLDFYIQDIDRKGSTINYKKINNYSPDILFSSLGSPWQEKNIYHSSKKISSLKLGLGIGGSFDFITGKKNRAPKIFRAIGLEWFWRLILQPNRIARIYNALFVFMWKFLIWRFVLPLFYRSNVACLLFKKENNNMKILFVKRNEKDEHWQLPQGGTEGESLSVAGTRELREELGTDKFKKIKTYKNLYKYKFPKESGSKFNAPAKLISGYRGQKQGLFIAEFFGDDSDLKINFWEHLDWKWVKIEDALETIHPLRKDSLKIFIKKLKNI